MDYNLKLEFFEGPLDLLLHLLDKDKIDIYDIPIAKVAEQYIEYLQAFESFNIDFASEFLVMAATLLQIKSRMLLPRLPKAAAEIAEEDPRQELVERLLEYKRFKQVTAILEEMAKEKEKYYSRLPQEFPSQVSLPSGLSLDDLIKAFAAVWESASPDYTLISREEISVQDKMYDIIKLLHLSNGRLEFSETIIRTGTRSEVITAFLAMLELIRLKRIGISQEKGFSKIFITLKE